MQKKHLNLLRIQNLKDENVWNNSGHSGHCHLGEFCTFRFYSLIYDEDRDVCRVASL